MQVHYNLLAGAGDGRLPHAAADRAGVSRPDRRCSTMLLPAPVELPCRPQHADGPLCDRDGRRGRRQAALRRRRRPPPTCCTCCVATRCGPAARRPARARSASPPRSSPSPATCTCSGGRSRSRSTRAGPTREPSSTSRSGTSTTRAAKPIEPATAAAVRHRQGHLQARPVAARPAAGVRGAARPLRRLGRGHDRRDVPGHPVGHPSLSPVCDASPARLRRLGSNPLGGVVVLP